jgi:cytochrome P450
MMPIKMHISIYTKLFATITVLGSMIFILIRRFLVRHRFARDYGCQPVARCLSRDPFLGLDIIPKSIRALKQHKILERGCEYFAIYGNTFTVKELHKSIIVTIEPENIKTILSLNFGHYGVKHRLEAFRPLLGEGIFDTDGDHWAASRSLIRPSFTRNQMADFATLEDLIQHLFVLLPRDGKTVVDLQDLFSRYTLDSATEFLFGQSVGSLKQIKQGPDFAEAFCYAQRNIIVRATLGQLKALYRDAKADECHRICRGFAQPFVDEAFRVNATKKAIQEQHPKTAGGKRIFSHELASRTADRHRVLNESMNLLLAGRDTTASLLSNLFFMLAKNPAIWAKLRKEVACLQGCPPTYEQLKSLKYVEYCLRECKSNHFFVRKPR